MTNSIKIWNDSFNSYIELRIRKGIFTKVLLIGFMTSVFLCFCLILFNLEGAEVGKLIIPITLIFCLFFALPIRTSLWNLGGVERLVINQKTLTHSSGYLFFQMQPKTYHYNTLIIKFIPLDLKSRNVNQDVIGKIEFANIRQNDGLEEVVFKSAIRILKSDFEKIFHFIHESIVLKTYSEVNFENCN